MLDGAMILHPSNSDDPPVLFPIKGTHKIAPHAPSDKDFAQGVIKHNALYIHLAAHRFGEFFHQGQAQPCALLILGARIFASIKALPDVREFLRRDTFTRIAYVKPHQIGAAIVDQLARCAIPDGERTSNKGVGLLSPAAVAVVVRRAQGLVALDGIANNWQKNTMRVDQPFR